MEWNMLSSFGAIGAAAVATWQLYLNRRNSQKESFQSTFNALLEQHFNAHANIRNYIRNIRDHYKEETLKKNENINYTPKKLNSVDHSLYVLLCSYFEFDKNGQRKYEVNGNVYKLVNTVRDNSVLSPYFRQVYHMIKLIDEDEHFKKCDIKTDRKGMFSIIPGFFQDYCNSLNMKRKNEVILEKKKYTNILRSYIDDDILLLVAINALKINNNNNDVHNSDYEKYRDLLIKFDFLQHLRLLAWHKKGYDEYVELQKVINYIELVKNGCDTTVLKNEEIKKNMLSTYQYIYLYEFANYIYGNRGGFNKDLIVGHTISVIPKFSDDFTVDTDDAVNVLSALIDDINNKKL